jgi:hypothetical protein
MQDPDIVNIPAFKRKRSISARGRKKPSYDAILKPKKTTRKRPSSVKTVEPELSPDIPITQVFPSEELFDESPIIEESSPRSSKIRNMVECGQCDGYFDSIEVAVIKVTSVLRIGDQILMETSEGLFEQPIESMQIDRKDVQMARSGSDIGIKVAEKPTVGGTVYKVID